VNLEKAFDTPDLISFTGMPINAVDLPIQGAGATNSGTACTTVEYSGSGTLEYDNQTHDEDQNSDCGGNSTTKTEQLASGLAWDDKWTNQVFGGRADSSALNGTESDSGTVDYDYSGCGQFDPNSDNQCGVLRDDDVHDALVRHMQRSVSARDSCRRSSTRRRATT